MLLWKCIIHLIFIEIPIFEILTIFQIINFGREQSLFSLEIEIELRYQESIIANK